MLFYKEKHSFHICQHNMLFEPSLPNYLLVCMFMHVAGEGVRCPASGVTGACETWVLRSRHGPLIERKVLLTAGSLPMLSF